MSKIRDLESRWLNANDLHKQRLEMGTLSVLCVTDTLNSLALGTRPSGGEESESD